MFINNNFHRNSGFNYKNSGNKTLGSNFSKPANKHYEKQTLTLRFGNNAEKLHPALNAAVEILKDRGDIDPEVGKKAVLAQLEKVQKKEKDPEKAAEAVYIYVNRETRDFIFEIVNPIRYKDEFEPAVNKVAGQFVKYDNKSEEEAKKDAISQINTWKNRSNVSYNTTGNFLYNVLEDIRAVETEQTSERKAPEELNNSIKKVANYLAETEKLDPENTKKTLKEFASAYEEVLNISQKTFAQLLSDILDEKVEKGNDSAGKNSILEKILAFFQH